MSEESSEPSGRHISGIVLAGALAIFMVNTDATVVNIILPALSDQFNMGTGRISLVVISYLLALTGTALMFGRLSDLKGPERVFISGYLVFALASLFCALAWSMWSLVLFRFLQGLGGAMIFATSAVIVMRYIPARMRGRAYAVNGMMAGIGFALGSPVGGFLAHHFSWRMVFLVNIPIGLLGLALCLKFLTRRDATAKNPYFDVWGAVSSFAALAVLVFTLQSFSGEAMFSIASASGLLIAAILGGIFLRIEKRLEAPLLDLSIFKNRLLNFALAGTACYYALLQGTSIVFPFFFIKGLGFSEMQTGYLLFVGPVVTIVVNPLAGWLCDRVGPKVPSLFGAGLFIVASVLLLTFDLSTALPAIVGTLFILGVGLSFYSAPILTLTMSHAEPETLGVLSSIKAVVPLIVGMIGVGIFATTYSRTSEALQASVQKSSLVGFHAAMYLALAVAILCLFSTMMTKSRQQA